MAKVKEDQELEFELQELYLTGKQWLSDIAFLEEELGFLIVLMGKFSFPLPGDLRRGKHDDMLTALPLREAAHAELKKEVTAFMNKLEPLIVDPASRISLQLIDDYVLLKGKIENALLDLKSIKYACINVYRNNE
jgi:hypothetical protein